MAREEEGMALDDERENVRAATVRWCLEGMGLLGDDNLDVG